jgi:PilZ domain
MSERRTARRYDLALPVIIRVPVEKEAASRNGKTRDISTRGLYFTIDQDLGTGAELDITLTLPAEVTRGTEVFIRAMGKVVRVDKAVENSSPRVGVAAEICSFVSRGALPGSLPRVAALRRRILSQAI